MTPTYEVRFYLQSGKEYWLALQTRDRGEAAECAHELQMRRRGNRVDVVEAEG